MDNRLNNVINYCRVINGSKGYNNTKTQLINEMVQDYNIGREDTIYRFDVLVNSIDGKDVYVNDSETPIRGVIDISRKQTADTEMEERLQVYPNQVKRGDYVKFKVNETDELRTYLIKSKMDKKHGYDEGIFEECNYDVKWMYKNVLYTTPCIISNQTKYTLGVSNQVVGITEGSSRYQISMGYNTFSKKIDEGQRFIFNGNAWRTTQVDWISETGLLSILLGQDSINYEVDDILGEIAGAFANKHTYTYNIPTSFEVANGSEYVINYSIKDETGKDFDYSLITVTTTNNTLVQLVNDGGVISVKGLSTGIGSIKLSVPIGSTSEDFIINFEVKAVVADKVEYTTNFSQGTNIKQYVTSTLVCSKTTNSVSTPLNISYSLDTVGQSLISSNKIVITTKNSSSITIKNALITSLTTIYLTVVDTSNNTKILDNQPIILTGM